MNELTLGSLFSGIGALSLGLERAGMRLIWVAEIDPYASAVLKKHHPLLPNHGGIRGIDPTSIERPDVLCGGFPCQDISFAGKGAGLAGARSGLWYEYLRLIEAFHPLYAVIENVSALRNRGLDEVLRSLAEIGYDAEWYCIPAAAVGAPHRRDRVWLVAYPMADADGPRLEGRIRAELQECAGEWAARARGTPTSLDGSPADQWFTEPDVGRVADGVASRVDRLRCLGNSVVPQVAEIVGRVIVADQGVAHVVDI
jgi:DNA (cytosine-5)-methyltransferase 1